MIANPPGTRADDVARLTVCLCTCQRPTMLARCLESLGAQILPDDLAISLVVVDNDPASSARLTVAQFCADAPFSVYYVHQPERGIARARNAALGKALDLAAGWIAMLDDDEIAEPDWIAQLMHPDYLDVPVLMGRNIAVYPTPRPFWVQVKEGKSEEGQRLKTAYTGNVRFSIALLQAGLRFDEGLGLMGGEDDEFFALAHTKGFEIRRTLRAVTYEPVHPERLTYGAQVHRAYWCAASQLRRLSVTRTWGGAALRKAHTIPLNLLFGSAWLLASSVPAALFVFAFMLTRIDGSDDGWAARASMALTASFKTMALGGGKKLAKGLGRGTALIGILPQPYRSIHGA